MFLHRQRTLFHRLVRFFHRRIRFFQYFFFDNLSVLLGIFCLLYLLPFGMLYCHACMTAKNLSTCFLLIFTTCFLNLRFIFHKKFIFVICFLVSSFLFDLRFISDVSFIFDFFLRFTIIKNGFTTLRFVLTLL